MTSVAVIEGGTASTGHLSIYLTIYLSIYLPTYLPTYLLGLCLLELSIRAAGKTWVGGLALDPEEVPGDSQNQPLDVYRFQPPTFKPSQLSEWSRDELSCWALPKLQIHEQM